MNELQQAKKEICDLKGSLMAMQAVTFSILGVMPAGAAAQLERELERHIETARALLLGSEMAETVLSAFDREAQTVVLLLSKLRQLRSTPPGAARSN